MKEFILPELGENIESALVIKLMINTGDYVKIDQPVLEIETDKATIEVPSTIEGVVHELLIKEGEKAKVGQVVFRVKEVSGQTKSEPVVQKTISQTKIEEVKPAAANKEVTQSGNGISEFVLPELGENIESAVVLKVMVSKGDFIEQDQGVLEIETDKATIEVPSTVSGKVIDVFVREGEKAKVGQVILKVQSDIKYEAKPIEQITKPEIVEKEIIEAVKEVELISEEKVSETTIQLEGQPPIQIDAAPAAPSVRRLARELGVDINKIPGSGPAGRISLDDVKAFVKKLNEGRAKLPYSSESPVQQVTLPDFTKFGAIERQQMTTIREKTAVHLSHAWNSIPHVTQFDKADITELEKMRKQFSPIVEKEGGKLTVTAILIKIAAAALKVFPQFNSSVDIQSKEIIFKKYFNIGVAVDTDRGLIVPVIRDIDKKNIKQIAKELNEISDKARNRKVTPDDLQGGCFSISNLGGIGGTFFTPIVNSPEVAILGVSRSSYEPVYINGEFQPRLIMPLSLSYDHRVIDGADGIRFLRWIIEALEQPMKVLVEG